MLKPQKLSAKKYKCVVIDDEGFSVEKMVDYIERAPDLEVMATYTDPVLALSELRNAGMVDFIFLDVHMPGLSGIEIAEELRGRTRFLVFATGDSKHALKAYNLKVDQYLLKPFSFAHFLSTINDLLDQNRGTTSQLEAPKKQDADRIFIRCEQKHSYLHLNLNEILYVQAAGNHVVICTPTEQIVTYMGLSHMEAALDKDRFVRISKSYIVALSAITKVNGHMVKLVSNKSLQMGDKYRAAFLEFLQNHLLNKT